ncbi:FHA domain-containing protein [Spirosoma sp. HMF3257]|uniref:FHA domain-containing protein n=1 Tax=Spirosoma telluris TaxID=2183553 RepID=A0A327NSE4_9BACT|nr:FHA domain-containing protein [Spirosoma telluris]RAI77655.1 FHA domain-containing protein [Spirosoma telluris]
MTTSPLSEENLQELILRLSQLPNYTIGRAADNRIQIDDRKIGRYHASLIQCSESSFILEDIGSKNGIFVDGLRISRKVVDRQDVVRLADREWTISDLVATRREIPLTPEPAVLVKTNPLDFTREFAALRQVYEQYPTFRKDCRNRDKMIRTGSVILSSVVGIGAALSAQGGALPMLQILSGAGLGMLVPTLCSTLLSTEEKLEVIDKEYRERYRCPNPDCRDPFANRDWELLAQQKTCRRCKAIWVS